MGYHSEINGDFVMGRSLQTLSGQRVGLPLTKRPEGET